MLSMLLLLLILVSWLYWLLACYLVLDFFQTPPQLDTDFVPPVSILKPVKGLDAQAYQNFASFCRQDYPDYELLFGVADPADPVIPLVERLKRDFPERAVRLLVAPPFGANRKVSLLHHLEGQAHSPILVVSDSDMRATPGYLRQVVTPLADTHIGLVTCPYRGEMPLTLSAGLEALHMGATFLPSVVAGRKVLNMRFAMGATVALRRSDLARIGGFAAVADYLADDYQLGARIAKLGLKVHLSHYMMASILGPTTFHEQWDREVRWTRCIRASRPREYPTLLLTFSTPLSVALVLITGFAPQGLMALAVSLLLRWWVAWRVSDCTGDQEVRKWLLWLPVRDMLSALVWCAGGLGRTIIWRGEEFELLPDGRMQPRPRVADPQVKKHAWRF